MTAAVVASLGGRAETVDDPDRAAYHAAASIAANHMVALIGQVERVAASAGLPLDAFSDLMRAALDDALVLGPRRALTGPASRGDWDTVDRHRKALSALAGPRTELAAYDAMVGLARRLTLESEPARDRGPAAAGPGRAAAVGGVAGGMSTVTTEAAARPWRPTGSRRSSPPGPDSPCSRPSSRLLGGPGRGPRGRADRWAWCPPWAPCTRATAPSSSGPPGSATWWRCPSSSTPPSSVTPADLALYPRTLDADLEVVAAAGGDLVFAPSVAEMYPDGRAAGPAQGAP